MSTFNMSDYLEAQIYNHMFRSATFTKPPFLAFALCSGVPNDANTGSNVPELAGATPNYKRVVYIQADSGWQVPVAEAATANTQPIQWPVAGAGWGTISGIAICDSIGTGSGNMLFWASLTTPRLVLTGDQFQFASGNLTALFD